VGRWIAQQVPLPALHVMAVSSKVLGGSLTLGCTAQNGDLFGCWCSWHRLPVPLPSFLGPVEVLPDAVLPFAAVSTDDRAYLAVPVPNFPSAIGVGLHFQGARMTPSLQVQASNAASVTLR
jgi:hypothetical protein